MSVFTSFAVAATLTAGPAGLDTTVGLQGPSLRVVEGVFVENHDSDIIQYFEQGAALPPNAERIATLTRSGMSGHVARVSPGADNELRLIAERPQAFDMFEPEFEGQEVSGVIGVMDDEWGDPIAFVTSERTDVIGLVVTGPGGIMQVIEQDPNATMPMDVDYKELVIGVIVPNARGGVNALMDQVVSLEVQSLLEMYRPVEEKPEAGQN